MDSFIVERLRVKATDQVSHVVAMDTQRKMEGTRPLVLRMNKKHLSQGKEKNNL